MQITVINVHIRCIIGVPEFNFHIGLHVICRLMVLLSHSLSSGRSVASSKRVLHRGRSSASSSSIFFFLRGHPVADQVFLLAFPSAVSSLTCMACLLQFWMFAVFYCFGNFEIKLYTNCTQFVHKGGRYSRFDEF